MTDPMDSLNGMQSALNEGLVSLQPCETHQEIGVLFDQPNGVSRFSYVQLNGVDVQAIALIVLTESIEGLPCFQIGYAVNDQMRLKGLGKGIINKALTEFRNGMYRNSVKDYYIEAIISRDNIASIQIAKSIFPNNPLEIEDELSGEPAYQYLKKVTGIE